MKATGRSTNFIRRPADGAGIRPVPDDARPFRTMLTEKEHAVYRRGRNAKSVSPAKNQSMTDYRRATGFEALMGYLYLNQEWKRMLELGKDRA